MNPEVTATIKWYVKYRHGALHPINWMKGYCDDECSWETELCFEEGEVRRLLLEHGTEWHDGEKFAVVSLI